MADLTTRSKPNIVATLPLLLLALIGYNVAMLMGHNFSNASAVLHLKLISGADWTLGSNEIFLISGLFLLFIEIVKSTRAASHTMFEHMLSMIVFIVFLVEFLVVAGAGTSTFLLLGIMSLIDVLAGYTISIAVARKEMNITG